MKRIRLENPDIDMAELEMRAREEVMSKGPKSRAYYRMQATRKLAGKQNIDKARREALAMVRRTPFQDSCFNVSS